MIPIATLVITMVAAAGVLFLYTGIAPVAKVTVTTTITATTPTITATTASTSADTSQIAGLTRYLNLSNKTTLLNNATVSIGPAVNCGVGCSNANATNLVTFHATYAGFVLLSGYQKTGQEGAGSLEVDYKYSSIANGISCSVNSVCNYDAWGLDYPSNGQPPYGVFPVLPGDVTVVLLNNGNQTLGATLTIAYYG
jgi:hypothetical protein